MHNLLIPISFLVSYVAFPRSQEEIDTDKVGQKELREDNVLMLTALNIFFVREKFYCAYIQYRQAAHNLCRYTFVIHHHDQC